MASTVFEVLDNIEKGRQHAIKNAKLANLPATDNMGIHSLGDLFLMQNNTETIIPDNYDDWERPNDWFNIPDILANAEEKDGLYPAYIISLLDTFDTTLFSKTTTGAKLYGDGYLTSDGSWYKETEVTHTWDRTKDKECSEGYKTRYVIVYVADRSKGMQLDLKEIPILEIFGDKCNIYSFKVSGSNVYTGVNCFSIRNVEFTENTTFGSFANGAFNYCKNLERVKVPTLLSTSNSSSCFYLNINLRIIDFPNLKTIGSQVFRNCYSLKKVTLPSVTTIAADGFQECRNLKEVNIPNLEEDSGGFAGCSSLETVSFPKLKKAGDTFSGCYNLKNVFVPQLEIMTGSTFSSCSLLKSVSLDNVTELGANSFYESGIKELSFPKIKVIKQNAFKNMPCIESLTIPSTVETIETTNIATLFDGNMNLKNLTLYNGWKISGLKLESCFLLSKESIINIFNALADVTTESTTYELILGEKNKLKVSEEELLIATTKGWVIK